MVQWLRALASCRKDLDSVPSTHRVAHNHLLTPVPWASGALFWSLGALHNVIPRHTGRLLKHLYTQIIFFKVTVLKNNMF